MPHNKDNLSTLLLDTHIWLWAMTDESKLNSTIIKAINTAASKSKILVSIISVWEVGMLVNKKRITLPYHCLEWVNNALKAPGFHLAGLTPEIAVYSTHLPGILHGDPCDHILIATALSHQATFVTVDQNIINYAKKNPLQTLSM